MATAWYRTMLQSRPHAAAGDQGSGCKIDPDPDRYKSLVLKIRSGTALMMAMTGLQNHGT
jgi:hypothetical protein